MSKYSLLSTIISTIKTCARLNKQNVIPLLFLLFMCLFSWLPFYDVELLLSTGDHGRDLCAYESAYEGKSIYRDFYWDYGPLMPYYYSMFFRIFGVNIKSVLAGSAVIQILSSLILYLLLRCFLKTLPSLAGALYFMTLGPHFFHTFNHSGAVLCVLIIWLSFFKYCTSLKPSFIGLALIFLWLSLFIKINIGISMYCALVLMLTLFKWRKIVLIPQTHYVAIAFFMILILVVSGLLYSCYFNNLPDYWIRQCFMYSPKMEQCNPKAFFTLLARLSSFCFPDVTNLNLSTWQLIFLKRLLLLLIVITACVKCGWLIITKHSLRHKNIFFITGIIFALFLSHEFLLGSGHYKLFWITPIVTVISFLGIDYLLHKLRKFLLILYLLILIGCLSITSIRITDKIDLLSSYNFISYPKGQIFVGNDFSWISTLKHSINYLLNHLSPNETFFAWPYDPLYYFLTNKKNPSLEVSLLSYMNVTQDQENNIIASLENKRVNYILLSNRFHEKNIKYRIRCHRLLNYISTHYKVVVTYGDWKTTPGWTKNHAVKIFKRSKPFVRGVNAKQIVQK